MDLHEQLQSRHITDSDWYWVSKIVIQQYVPKVGATAIVVYSFLSSLADRSQRCFPSQKYIAASLGYSRSTIKRALQTLVEHQLIAIGKRHRWSREYQLCRVTDERVGKNGITGERGMAAADPEMVHERTQDGSPIAINKKNEQELLTTNRNDCSDEFKYATSSTREQLLARDIAEGLGDLRGLPLYERYARLYPESVLREILSQVRAVRNDHLIKGRAALFHYLVRRYAEKRSSNNPRS